MAQIPPTKPHLQLIQCKITLFGFLKNYEQYSVGLYGLYKNELSTKYQHKTVNTFITLHLKLSWPLHTLLFATQPRLTSFYLPISDNFTAAPSEAALSDPVGLEARE